MFEQTPGVIAFSPVARASLIARKPDQVDARYVVPQRT
jgi:hypothetical protein